MSIGFVVVGLIMGGLLASPLLRPEDWNVAGVIAVGMSESGEPMVRAELCRGKQETLVVERLRVPQAFEEVTRIKPRRTIIQSSVFPVESSSPDWHTESRFDLSDFGSDTLAISVADPDDAYWRMSVVQLRASEWRLLKPGGWLATRWGDGPGSAGKNVVLSGPELHEFACD